MNGFLTITTRGRERKTTALRTWRIDPPVDRTSRHLADAVAHGEILRSRPIRERIPIGGHQHPRQREAYVVLCWWTPTPMPGEVVIN